MPRASGSRIGSSAPPSTPPCPSDTRNVRPSVSVPVGIMDRSSEGSTRASLTPIARIRSARSLGVMPCSFMCLLYNVRLSDGLSSGATRLSPPGRGRRGPGATRAGGATGRSAGWGPRRAGGVPVEDGDLAQAGGSGVAFGAVPGPVLHAGQAQVPDARLAVRHLRAGALGHAHPVVAVRDRGT